MAWIARVVLGVMAITIALVGCGLFKRSKHKQPKSLKVSNIAAPLATGEKAELYAEAIPVSSHAGHGFVAAAELSGYEKGRLPSELG